jgi:hypothetical protein
VVVYGAEKDGAVMGALEVDPDVFVAAMDRALARYFQRKAHAWLARSARERAADLRARIAAMPASEAARLWRKLIAGLQ